MNFTEIGSTEIFLNDKLVSQDQTYTSLSFNSSHNFVFSNQTDNLPITTTYVGMKPCMNPDNLNYGTINTLVYEGDITGKLKSCTEQPNELIYDSRY